MKHRNLFPPAIFAAFAAALFIALQGCGPVNAPTTGPTPTASLVAAAQVTADGLAATEAAVQLAYAGGQIPAPEWASIQLAEKAANSALASVQKSAAAGDQNGYDIAMQAFDAALLSVTNSPSVAPVIAAMKAKH